MHITKVVKAGRVREAGHVARRRGGALIWWENLKEIVHLVFRGVDGRIILKCVLKKIRRSWTGIIWLRIETSDAFKNTVMNFPVP